MPDLHPDHAPQEYEAPAIVPLGSMDELTGQPDETPSVVLTVTLDGS